MRKPVAQDATQSAAVDLARLMRAIDTTKKSDGKGGKLQKFQTQLEKTLEEWGLLNALADIDSSRKPKKTLRYPEIERLVSTANHTNWRDWLETNSDRRPKSFPIELLWTVEQVTKVSVIAVNTSQRPVVNKLEFVTLSGVTTMPLGNSDLYPANGDCLAIRDYTVKIGQLRLYPKGNILEPALEAVIDPQGNKVVDAFDGLRKTLDADSFGNLGSYDIWAQNVTLDLEGLEPREAKDFVKSACEAKNNANIEDQTQATQEKKNVDEVLIRILNAGDEDAHGGRCERGNFIWQDESRDWAFSAVAAANAPAATLENLKICKIIAQVGTVARVKVFVQTEDIHVDFKIKDRSLLPSVKERHDPTKSLREHLIAQALKQPYIHAPVHMVSEGRLYFE